MLPASIFGQSIVIGERYGFDGLPLLYAHAFEGRRCIIGTTPCIIATPTGALRPLQAQKLCQLVLESEQVPCLIHAEGASAYQRRAMTERGVAWIAAENTFSIPFLAVSSSARELRKRAAACLSANAQRIATGVLGGRLIGLTTTEVASQLGVSLSSAGNYFSELEAIVPDIIGSNGRTRFLQVPEGMARADLYRALRPFMRSPVKGRAFIKLNAHDEDAVRRLPLSGVSALSHLTDINDDPWRTVAHFGKGADDLFSHSEIVSEHDDPDLAVESWRYTPWATDGMVDTVSLLVELEEITGASDERLEDAIETLRGLVFA